MVAQHAGIQRTRVVMTEASFGEARRKTCCIRAALRLRVAIVSTRPVDCLGTAAAGSASTTAALPAGCQIQASGQTLWSGWQQSFVAADAAKKPGVDAAAPQRTARVGVESRHDISHAHARLLRMSAPTCTHTHQPVSEGAFVKSAAHAGPSRSRPASCASSPTVQYAYSLRWPHGRPAASSYL